MGKLQFLKIPDLFLWQIVLLSSVIHHPLPMGRSHGPPWSQLTFPTHGQAWPPDWHWPVNGYTEAWRPESNVHQPLIFPSACQEKVCTKREFSFCLDPETQNMWIMVSAQKLELQKVKTRWTLASDNMMWHHVCLDSREMKAMPSPSCDLRAINIEAA